MANQLMEFQQDNTILDFSEAKITAITVRMFDNIHSNQMLLNEKNLIELRKWISKQIRQIQKNQKK